MYLSIYEWILDLKILDIQKQSSSCIFLFASQVVPTIYTNIRGQTIQSNQVLLSIWKFDIFQLLYATSSVLFTEMQKQWYCTVLCHRAF